MPWYVNGSLKGEELAAVERHLRECARCRREVDWLHQLHAVCAAGATEPDASASFRRLRNRIEGSRTSRGLAQRLRRPYLAWLRTAYWAKWTIAAEFGAIAAMALLVVPGREPPATYRTLGAPATPVAPAGTLAVAFDPKITEFELRRIVDGPTASSAYVLQVPARRPRGALAVLRAAPAVVLATSLTGKQEP